MKRFGLIGHPVAGSFSPRLFEAAYEGRYAYDLIEGAEFGASWRRFLDEYDGINITAPFKQDAFRAVDVLSDDARLCGAVNLAVKTPAGIVGHNTDVAGVLLAVREALAALPSPIPGSAPSVIPGTTSSVIPGASPAVIPGLTGNLSASATTVPESAPSVIPGLTGNPPASADLSHALVVGCGGAGRAAAVAALRLGCRVTLANRTSARAAELAAELNAHLCAHAPIGIDFPATAGPAVDWIPVEDLPSLAPDLVIYTVPGPMEGIMPVLRRDPEPTDSQQTNNQSVTNTSVPAPSEKKEDGNSLVYNYQKNNSLQKGRCQVSLHNENRPSPSNEYQPSPFKESQPSPFLFPDAVILEANYRTPCLEGCGRAYISGLRWLLYQAVAGYDIFTGETPDADAMFQFFC